MEEKFIYTAVTNCGDNTLSRPVKFIGTMEQINALRDEYVKLSYIVIDEEIKPYEVV